MRTPGQRGSLRACLRSSHLLCIPRRHACQGPSGRTSGLCKARLQAGHLLGVTNWGWDRGAAPLCSHSLGGRRQRGYPGTVPRLRGRAVNSTPASQGSSLTTRPGSRGILQCLEPRSRVPWAWELALRGAKRRPRVLRQPQKRCAVLMQFFG